MRPTGARAYARPAPTPTMPPGLVELMEGLAKDVLKKNPENVYEFCAAHMQKLLEIRDGPPPPTKQFSLEQKIAVAREKLRQRIKNRLLQHNKIVSEHSSAKVDFEDAQHIREVPINKSAVQPVIHGEFFLTKNEVEIFHVPNPIIASDDTSTNEPLQVVNEVIEAPYVEHEAKAFVSNATEEHDTEGSSEKVIKEENTTSVVTDKSFDVEAIQEPELVSSVDVQSNEHIETRTLNEDNSQSQMNEQGSGGTDTGNNAEEKTTHLNEKVPKKEIIGDELNEVASTLLLASKTVAAFSNVSDITTPKLDNFNKEEAKKETIGAELNQVASTMLLANKNVAAFSDSDVKTTKTDNFIEEIPNKETIGAELNQVASTMLLANKTVAAFSDSDVKTAETDNFNEEVPKKEVIGDEFNEVASMMLLASKTVTAFSNISDVTTTVNELVEEPKIEVEAEKLDTQHEEILLKKRVSQLESDKKLDDITEEQTIMKEELTNIQHEEKLVDINEAKGYIEGITQADDKHVVEENHDDSPTKSDDSVDPTVEKVTIIPLETPQTEGLMSANSVLPSTDTNMTKAKGAESQNNQMITVETTEGLTIDDIFGNKDDTGDQGVHNNRVTFNPQAGKKLNIDGSLLELGREHYDEFAVKENDGIQDTTSISIKRDSITESDELTAVSGMDLETAAITIQKVFRTFLFSKSRTSTLDDAINENSLDEDIDKKDEPEYALTNANINKERRTLGISRMDTVLQTVNEEKSLSLSDDSSLSSAATTIQAHVRGFLVRNRLASNKTASSSSLVNSDGPSTSLDGDSNEPKKTILNIHIVPERGQFMSRDESLLTSIDLPLDSSPPSSINLHPLGYDKSAERRKQLKREDAVQSISPPSNTSGKLSEEVDSVKETHNDSHEADLKQEHVSLNDHDKPHEADTESCDTTLTMSSTAETVVDADNLNPREVLSSPEHIVESDNKPHEVVTSSDEMDVVTPSTISAKITSVNTENDDKPKLVHSGEFHDIVVQTQVKRSEASVVREFKNVLVYFLVWDKT